MASNAVTVHLCEGCSVRLESNSPDIGLLVKEIASNRMSIDPDAIKIECDYEPFGQDGFKDVISTAVRDFMKAIELEETLLKDAVNSLATNSSEAPND